MIYRFSRVSDIPLIAELKLKMFKEVGMSHLLIDHFLEEVISTYTTLYTSESAQHYVIEEEGKIIACAGAFIKEDIPVLFLQRTQIWVCR
jgi:N-acetylglutamate synthase-like GNAT family acetyltransferase